MTAEEIQKYEYIKDKISILGFDTEIRDAIVLTKAKKQYGKFPDIESVYNFICGYEWGLEEGKCLNLAQSK